MNYLIITYALVFLAVGTGLFIRFILQTRRASLNAKVKEPAGFFLRTPLWQSNFRGTRKAFHV